MPAIRTVLRAVVMALAMSAIAACQRTTTSSATSAESTAQDPSAFAFEEADITTLQARMTRGELTSRALTLAYLDRIAAIDDAGPRLNAVIETNPDALKEADARDAERKAGRVRSPLHGIPVLLKDNIDATPMVNSAGSMALAKHRPKTDAFLVQRLRESGAVILGKTNLSEWANFRSDRSTSGWSARGGQTKNPYALDRSPCGSSSGSGSAIAANLAVVAIGTETDGSILCPAAVNGLVGLKPTVGLVSRSGVIPISHSQDTPGPMARSVADAALLLAAITGRDDNDAATAPSVGRALFDYRAYLRPDALKGARIGVRRNNDVAFQPELNAAFERALAVMQKAGATLVDVEIANDRGWGDLEQEVLLYEFKAGLRRYLAYSNAPVRTLAGLIAFNKAFAAREMPFFAQELFEQANAKGPLTDMAYIQARTQARKLASEALAAALDAQQLDALVSPTTGPAWMIDPVNGDPDSGASYGAAAVAGTPGITVPMGDSRGLPVGIAFLGRAWSEPRLIELAYAFEQATRARRPPRFLPTIDVAQ